MSLRQRQPPIKSKKLRDSAHGQDCTLQIMGVCNHNPETTVLCHIAFEGGTMGGKAPDWSAVFGCSDCHAAIDQRKLGDLDELFYTRRALQRTWDIWIRDGIIKI